MKYTTHFQTRQTPQSQPIPGSTQVQNDAGGYAWKVDDWQQLDRFLILGSCGGTYYVSEQKLTVDNAEAVRRCIQADGVRVVTRIVEISEQGRAPKNEPALFALAMCAKFGNLETRQAAYDAWSRVARIGTDLFHLNQYCQDFGIGGRGYRNANARWYNEKSAKNVAYQAVKYQQRDGWTHRDVLRLAHPKALSEVHNAIYKWIVSGSTETSYSKELDLIAAFERAQKTEDVQDIKRYIREHGLTREMIPNTFLNDAGVWEALLEKMPLTAMIRNLGKMTQVELIKPMSNAATHVINELTDADRLKRARVHPVTLLAALITYQQGHGFKGSLSWSPVSQIVDALDRAFYLSFGNVEATGKRFCFGLDVSGSMAGTEVAGIPFLQCRTACGAMALISAAVEYNNLFVAFDDRGYQLSISPRQRLDDVVNLLAQTGGGGTDCAIPVLAAMKHKVPVDVFVILTDSQTWYGTVHPAQALEEYRRQMNIPAKMVVVAMASTGHTIAAPDDAGQLTVVGFDTATPELISEFAKGNI